MKKQGSNHERSMTEHEVSAAAYNKLMDDFKAANEEKKLLKEQLHSLSTAYKQEKTRRLVSMIERASQFLADTDWELIICLQPSWDMFDV